MINYNAALPAGNYPASKSSINVTDWIQGIKGNLSYLIRQAFRGGEVGFAYDPNDLTTLYQDAIGTIPVTASGQPVGLVLDKSKGLPATTVLAKQATFTFSPKGTVAPTTNSNDNYLGKSCVSVTFPQVASGGYAVSRAEGAVHRVISGKFYKWRYKIALSRKLVSGETVVVYVTGSHGSSQIALTRSTQDNVWIDGQSTAVVSVQGNNVFTVYAVALNSPVTIYATDFSADAIDIGNYAYQTVSASRPLLQRNATTGAYYLAFDGVDDFLQTNNIDFTSTDKVSVFAGVRKLSDAAIGVLAETSVNANSNVGAFYMLEPATAGISSTSAFVKGPTSAAIVSAVNLIAPTSYVKTVVSDLGGNTTKLRIDSVLKATSTTATGGGSLGNYPLYIGRRGGTSLPFNGHLYSLIIMGRLASDTETTVLENAIAKQIGATLNV